MNVEQESEALSFSAPIEEPLRVFVGDGSGAENTVGNEEKKKMFFFGQPGCLKNSPIKVNPPVNHNNHSKTTEGASSAEIKAKAEDSKPAEKETSAALVDDDEDSLLRKISEVLEEDETGNDLEKKSINETTSANSESSLGDQLNDNATSSKTVEKNCVNNNSEIMKNSQPSNNAEEIEVNDKANSNKSEPSESEAKGLSENVAAVKESSEVQSKINDLNDASESRNVALPKAIFSIVPYDDDDSTSSSTHIDEEKVQQSISEVDKTQTAAPPIDESASSIPSSSAPAETETVTQEQISESLEKQTLNESPEKPLEVVEEKTELKQSDSQVNLETTNAQNVANEQSDNMEVDVEPIATIDKLEVKDSADTEAIKNLESTPMEQDDEPKPEEPQQQEEIDEESAQEVPQIPETVVESEKPEKIAKPNANQNEQSRDQTDNVVVEKTTIEEPSAINSKFEIDEPMQEVPESIEHTTQQADETIIESYEVEQDVELPEQHQEGKEKIKSLKIEEPQEELLDEPSTSTIAESQPIVSDEPPVLKQHDEILPPTIEEPQEMLAESIAPPSIVEPQSVLESVDEPLEQENIAELNEKVATSSEREIEEPEKPAATSDPIKEIIEAEENPPQEVSEKVEAADENVSYAEEAKEIPIQKPEERVVNVSTEIEPDIVEEKPLEVANVENSPAREEKDDLAPSPISSEESFEFESEPEPVAIVSESKEQVVEKIIEEEAIQVEKQKSEEKLVELKAQIVEKQVEETQMEEISEETIPVLVNEQKLEEELQAAKQPEQEEPQATEQPAEAEPQQTEQEAKQEVEEPKIEKIEISPALSSSRKPLETSETKPPIPTEASLEMQESEDEDDDVSMGGNDFPAQDDSEDPHDSDEDENQTALVENDKNETIEDIEPEEAEEPVCIKKQAYLLGKDEEERQAVSETVEKSWPVHQSFSAPVAVEEQKPKEVKEPVCIEKKAYLLGKDEEERQPVSETVEKRWPVHQSFAAPVAVVETVHKVELKVNDLQNPRAIEIEQKQKQPRVFEEPPTTTQDVPKIVEKPSPKVEQKPVDETQEEVKELGKPFKEQENFTKPAVTRKRKISERKSISESDSEGNIVTDSVSHDNSSEDEEVVQKKKPRMRGKTTSPRKMPARKSAALQRGVEAEKAEEPEAGIEKLPVEEPIASVAAAKTETENTQTLQNLQFDYDESEDIAAKVAAIRTLICKDTGVKKESDSEQSDDSDNRKSSKRIRKTKRGGFSMRNEADSSSDEDSVKQTSKADSKRSKTNESKDQSPNKKKRESGGRGMLKHIDTSLVIDTAENETPVRQSRRIAQQKIREESDRRQMEEKMLKQMKAEAEKKKKSGDGSDEDEAYEEQKESSGEEVDDEDDASFKGAKRKKKSKIKASDKQWQTSSSHSEHTESEDYQDHVPSDPGSPLFKSDHEFSPESDDGDTTQVQPLKRARTAKKQEAVASSEEEDINPNHACQVCHKTDSPEWILLCDECDCGYHCSCLKPIIFLIPSGNWFCPLCCHKKLVDKMSEQLTQLDLLLHNIETIELRKQRQKLLEISQENILQERRKNARSRERTAESKASSADSKESGSSSDSESSDDAPLAAFYKLRKRNQTAAPSYRFNEYDDLINSAIKDEMEEVKGAGNLGRGKDISTIIEADKEEKSHENDEDGEVEDQDSKPPKVEDDESSDSDVIRRKKSSKKKKKKKLNNLDASSEEERVSDEDFKGSSDSEVDEEDLSMSSVSESSLDMPKKKGKGWNMRKSTRTREKRVDRRFINDSDSDDEPLVRPKRSKKKDSDEEEFDINDDDDEEGSLAEEIDSEDLCDDTDTDESSENAWPKKKKKRTGSYDQKPRKAPKKKDENEDKAFRAGISKKKVLKKSDNESEASESDNEKGRRKTRGKKLLYLIEDDLDSDESDGIKPGVKRPETPPEERELFVKKQEEIKRMLAAKDTEAAKKLAAPTIEPIHIAMETPKSPSPLPFTNEPSSLSTIPKNVIESAKALDTDYNRIKPMAFGSQSKGNLQPNDMNEEELARMMEEEDFAQHQLKLAGEAIARKKLLDLEAKEEQFAAFTKANRDKDWQSPPASDKKRSKKSKSAEKPLDEFPNFSKALSQMSQAAPTNLSATPMPAMLSSSHPQLGKPQMQPQPPSIIANLMQQQSLMQQQLPPFGVNPPSLTGDRPSVLSSFMSRPDLLPQHLKMHQPIPPDVFNQKMPSQQPLPAQPYDEEEERKRAGRRKKFTPLRQDLPEGNISKLAKLDPTTPSVIKTTPNLSVDDKSKGAPRPDHPKLSVAAPPQIFNPATNPTPSVITRLLQPQQRPGPGGPFPQGFSDVGQPGQPNIRMYASAEDLKNAAANKARGPLPPGALGTPLPQGSFGEHFLPRNIHPLYRGPTPYGMPPHARLPPYPFHHLHPNIRPGEYPPYNIPPQFSYYAPPAHSRQPPLGSALPLNHGAMQHVAGNEDISNSIRIANNSEEPSETSEFGGLVSYFSSQQELD